MRKKAYFLGLAACFFLAGCFSRVQTVKPELYSSLPDQIREAQTDFLNERESDLRVVDGKLAKARLDMSELKTGIRLADEKVKEKRGDLANRKRALSELKKVGGQPYEIQQLKTEIQAAKQQLNLAKQVHRYKRETERVAEDEMEVLEAHRKVLVGEMEFAKIKSVHEYTNFTLPQAYIQVADFNEQLRKFELSESRAKYRLARTERKSAKEKHKIYLLKQKLPDGGGVASEDTAMAF